MKDNYISTHKHNLPTLILELSKIKNKIKPETISDLFIVKSHHYNLKL